MRFVVPFPRPAVVSALEGLEHEEARLGIQPVKLHTAPLKTLSLFALVVGDYVTGYDTVHAAGAHAVPHPAVLGCQDGRVGAGTPDGGAAHRGCGFCVFRPHGVPRGVRRHQGCCRLRACPWCGVVVHVGKAADRVRVVIVGVQEGLFIVYWVALGVASSIGLGTCVATIVRLVLPILPLTPLRQAPGCTPFFCSLGLTSFE